MATTITGLTTDKAEFLYLHPALNGLPVGIEAASTPGPLRGASQITISPEGLTALAALAEDVDGHFDGRYVWIGGSEYTVRGL